jgi:hypothetical protein
MLRPILLLFALLVPELARAQHVTGCADLLPRDHVRDHDRAADVLRDARRLHRRERRLMGASFAFMAMTAAFVIPAALGVYPGNADGPRFTSAERASGYAGLVSLTGLVGTSFAGGMTGLRLDRCLRRAHFITPDAWLRGRRPHSGALIASLVPPLNPTGPFFLLGHVRRRARLLADLERRFAPPVVVAP